MNWIDITVYIIIILSVLIGTTRGLVRQVFSISALVGGIIIGLIFYDIAAEMFIKDNLVRNESIANVGAFFNRGIHLVSNYSDTRMADNKTHRQP